MSWELKEPDFNPDDIDDSIPVAPTLPAPAERTVVVDFVSEAEKPKTYVAQEGEAKPKDVRKAEGIQSYAPPVDVYETGFRSDVYEGLLEFFRKKRETKVRLDAIREKIGLRR